jgi:hypothetical protein
MCEECERPVPRVTAQWDRQLLIVPHCAYCKVPHYYTPEQLRRETAADGTISSHCRSNRARTRADRRYVLVEPLPALRERARAAIRGLLAGPLGLRPGEVAVVMDRGFDALLSP